MYYKIFTLQFFEILQQNQYNYIKLHTYFPLVQLLYCPSTTVMYSCTNSDKNLAQNLGQFYKILKDFTEILRKFNKIFKDFKDIFWENLKQISTI